MSSCLNAQLVAALAPSLTGLWEGIERPRTPRLDNIQSSEIWDVEPASRHYRDYLTLKCKSTWPGKSRQLQVIAVEACIHQVMCITGCEVEYAYSSAIPRPSNSQPTCCTSRPSWAGC